MKKNAITVLVIVMSFWGTMYSQTMDSLKLEYEKTSSNPKKSLLLNLMGNEIERQNLDSSLYYYKKALNLAQKTSSDTLIADCFANLGNVFLHKGHFDVSQDNYLKALKLYEKYPNHSNITKTYNGIALIHFYQKDYDEALANFTHIEKLLDSNTSKDSSNMLRFKGKIYNNMGICYGSKKLYDQALQYYAKGVIYSKKADDSVNLSSLYSNMGNTYVETKRYDLAEAIFKEALTVRSQNNDIYGLCRSYNHLGKLYIEMGKTEMAEQYLLTGLDYCAESNSGRTKALILLKLSEVMAQTKDFERAYQYYHGYYTLSDSLNNQETKKKIVQAEMQFKFDKEKQIAEEKLKRKDLLHIIIAILLIFSIIIAIVMYILQKAKMKNQQLKKEKIKEENKSILLAHKELMLKEKMLQQDLEYKNKELTTNVMYLFKKNQLIGEVSEKLMALKKDMKKDNQREVQEIILSLKNSYNKDAWEEFEVRFNQVYVDFYERLSDKFPDLTPNEKKLCAFLRLNMSSKEICSLSRQSTNSLNVARARLRKKLNLQHTDINLVTFLEQI